MNRFSRLLIFIVLLCYGYLYPQESTQPSELSIEATIHSSSISSPTEAIIDASDIKETTIIPENTLIDFYFDNTDLVDIINQFAARKGLNIALPTSTQGGPITQKITFKNKRKISLKEAERYLYTFLEMSGYNLIPDQSLVNKTDMANHTNAPSFCKVVRVDSNIAREPLPLFFNIPPQELPRSEQRIRAVYYLANLKVPDSSSPGGSQSPLDIMLKDMLSTNQAGQSIGTYMFDPKSNAIILVDKANVISSVMTIINELDVSGIRDSIQVIPLYNAGAKTIADLLKSQQGLAIGGQRPGTKGDSSSYFATNIRIVADERTNSLIFMGREAAIERLKEFVVQYLDAPIESGKSILHYYDLQYLDAEKFAVDLQNIVSRQTDSQSKQEFSGPESFFQGVIVRAEVPKVAEKIETQVAAAGAAGAQTPEEIVKGQVYKGGNRLIVAARSQDWARIKKLIQDLDKPQPQVILEVIIADIRVEDSRILGSQTRNPAEIDLPKGVNFQSGQLDNPFTDVPPTTLAADLLELNPPVVPTPAAGSSLATILTAADPGSLIISLNDPAGNGIWSVIQVLQEYDNAKIISHPFLVAQNNKEAHEVLSEIRRDFGDVNPANATAAVINQVDVRADVKVAMIPRISLPDRLSLQIRVDINRFTSATQSNLQRDTRLVETNANLHTGQILALGGLTNVSVVESTSETPILGRIPILGWLFRKNTQSIVKNNLVIFICPTIVQPRIRDAQHYYTKRKVDEAYEVAGDTSMDTTRDPITNFFFKPILNEGAEMIDNYLADARDTGLLIDRHSDLIKNKKQRPSSGCQKKKKKENSIPKTALKDRLINENNPLRIKQSKT